MYARPNYEFRDRNQPEKIAKLLDQLNGDDLSDLSSPEILREDYSIENENDNPAYGFECVHDICLVWAPQIQRIAALDSSPRQFDDRLSRILFSGSGEPHWLVSIFDGSVENDPGSDHARRVFDFFRYLFARAIPMELRHRVRTHRLRCFLHVL